jgi:pSer/pThr/pTyr-binding forkhead associated (FHA) protein
MSDEPVDPAGPVPEPTTMRLQAVRQGQGVEPSEPVHESEHVLTKADLATVEALRPGTALLVVLRGPNTGARFLLDDDEVMSGRHPDSDIFLDDVTVSRKHAIFRRTSGGFVVRDVGSLNGTYVNRELVDEATLATGDEVQIGKFRLVFYASQA